MVDKPIKYLGSGKDSVLLDRFNKEDSLGRKHLRRSIWEEAPMITVRPARDIITTSKQEHHCRLYNLSMNLVSVVCESPAGHCILPPHCLRCLKKIAMTWDCHSKVGRHYVEIHCLIISWSAKFCVQYVQPKVTRPRLVILFVVVCESPGHCILLPPSLLLGAWQRLPQYNCYSMIRRDHVEGNVMKC